ncbi:MAG: M15 family metallopeptidase [Chitinophagaceae bacterium]
MHACINIRIIMSICMLLLAEASFTQVQQQYLQANERGTLLLSDIKKYYLTVNEDSNQLMVPLTKYIPELQTPWPYASTNNFTQKILYQQPVALLRLPAAKALRAVADSLATLGYGIILFDAYRPYAVTALMWQYVPDERYTANPAKGSGHNRGATVDIGLYSLATKQPLAMPTPFDDFSPMAHHDYMELPTTVIANRTLLRNIMEHFGFVAFETEWWHYSFNNHTQRFPLMNFSFRVLHKAYQKITR